MPRIARVVIQGIPHHLTQRGNYQQIVFQDKEDIFGRKRIIILSILITVLGVTQVSKLTAVLDSS